MDRDAKIAESFLAPVGCALLARDTRIVERDGWYQVITPSSGSALGNEVVYSRVAAADAESAIHRTIADYAEHRLPFKWCVGPLTEPANFGELLERFDFTSYPIRGMAIDPRSSIVSLTDSSSRAPRDVTIEAVTPDSLDDYYACFTAGWELAVSDVAAWRDDHLRALATGRFHFFTARVDGLVVGTAGFITKEHSVYLVGGNVLPSHRGRGIYRALVDDRLQRAAALGFELATTQAREATSAPILEKLGFETLFRTRIFKREHAAATR